MTRITIEADDELLEEVAHGISVRAQQIHENPDDEFEVTAKALRALGNDVLYEVMTEDVEPLSGEPEEQFTLTIERDE